MHGNRRSELKISTETGSKLDNHLNFFMDRYESSYLEELKAFIEAVKNDTVVPVSGEEGLKAMIIAEAANKSLKENMPVRIN